MGKTVNNSGTSRSANNVSAVRPEQSTDDDRAFTEIRRVIDNVVRVLALHPWAFFVPFCLATSAGFIISLYTPRTYTASTSFESRNDPISMDLSLSAGAASFKNFRARMTRDLTSVGCMSEVVNRLNLLPDLPKDASGALTPESKKRRENLARSLAGRLKVASMTRGDDGDLIRITYTGSDSHIGRGLVEQVKQTYIQRTHEWIRSYLVDQRDYHARKLESAKVELVHARKAETALRLQHPLVDPTDPGAINLKLSQLETAEDGLKLRRREHEADLMAQRQVVAAMNTALPNTGVSIDEMSGAHASVATSPIVSQIRAEMHKIKEDIEGLRVVRGMTLQHPDVAELLAKGKQLEAELERQLAWSVGQPVPANSMVEVGPVNQPAVDEVLSPWDFDRKTAEVRIAATEEKIADIDRRLAKNEQLDGELREVKRNIFDSQEEFAEVRDRVTKARVAYTQLDGRLASIEPAIEAADKRRLVHFPADFPARGSSLPVSPKAKNILILSIVVGLIAGVVFVILAEIVDHVYRSSSQVARSLGLPILESIDEIVTTQDKRRILVQRLVVAPVVVGCGLLLTGMSGAMAFLSISQPTAYQKLRKIPEAAIEFFAGDMDRDDKSLDTDVF